VSATLPALSAEWADGYLAGMTAGYAAGWAGCDADLAQSWHEAAAPLARNRPSHAELEARRWGPGGRAHFADPRPGDYPGGPVGEPSGLVWLAGPAVHHHRCTDACRAYRPGWYSPAMAVAILRALPGDYTDVIASLTARRRCAS
jgi:hypothetical protein